MAGLLGSFETLASEIVEEHVQNFALKTLGTSMDEYGQSYSNQIVRKQVYAFHVIQTCIFGSLMLIAPNFKPKSMGELIFVLFVPLALFNAVVYYPLYWLVSGGY